MQRRFRCREPHVRGLRPPRECRQHARQSFGVELQVRPGAPLRPPGHLTQLIERPAGIARTLQPQAALVPSIQGESTARIGTAAQLVVERCPACLRRLRGAQRRLRTQATAGLGRFGRRGIGDERSTGALCGIAEQRHELDRLCRRRQVIIVERVHGVLHCRGQLRQAGLVRAAGPIDAAGLADLGLPGPDAFGDEVQPGHDALRRFVGERPAERLDTVAHGGRSLRVPIDHDQVLGGTNLGSGSREGQAAPHERGRPQHPAGAATGRPPTREGSQCSAHARVALLDPIRRRPAQDRLGPPSAPAPPTRLRQCLAIRHGPRILVRPRPHPLAVELLGGHRARSAGAPDPGGLGGDRQSEVDDPRPSVVAHEHVRRFDVAVDESGIVHRSEASANRFEHAIDGTRRGPRRNPCVEGLPADALHHQRHRIAVLDDLEDLDQRGMLDGSERPRLGQRRGDRAAAPAADDLQRDVSTEHRIGRRVDVAVRAATERLLECEASERGPGPHVEQSTADDVERALLRLSLTRAVLEHARLPRARGSLSRTVITGAGHSLRQGKPGTTKSAAHRPLGHAERLAELAPFQALPVVQLEGLLVDERELAHRPS